MKQNMPLVETLFRFLLKHTKNVKSLNFDEICRQKLSHKGVTRPVGSKANPFAAKNAPNSNNKMTMALTLRPSLGKRRAQTSCLRTQT